MCRPNSSKEGGGLAVYRHGINFELRLGISNFKYFFCDLQASIFTAIQSAIYLFKNRL